MSCYSVSTHGAWLVHQYHVFADSVQHQSLRGHSWRSFLASPARPGRSAAKRGRDSSMESTSSPLRSLPTPPSPLGPAHRTPDIALAARKAARAARATATVTSVAEALANTPAFVYRVSMAPAVHLSSPGQPRPTPMTSLQPLAVLAPGPAPVSVQSPADEFVALNCPSPPGSRSSTPPYELLSTDSDDATSVHALPARIAARASATVTSITGTSTIAPHIQIPDCRVLMSSAVGRDRP